MGEVQMDWYWLDEALEQFLVVRLLLAVRSPLILLGLVLHGSVTADTSFRPRITCCSFFGDMRLD